MAAPVLNVEQRQKLIEWLVAGFPYSLICGLFRTHGWEPLEESSLNHYRQRHREAIQAAVDARMASAWDAGLAQREARVKALCAHAAHLEEIKWTPDEKGKLHNEKAWRETLNDIAKEMGHRTVNANLNLSGSLEILSRIDADLEPL